LVRQGKSEVEAVRFALSTVADWDELRREIQRAANEEVIMNYRVKTLWLPGVCTSALSMLLLRLLQISSAPTPYVFWIRHDIALVVYWRWLLCLPLIGTLGAYWSRRAGGKLLDRVLAASLHILGLTCVMALIFLHPVCCRLSCPSQSPARGMYGLLAGLGHYSVLPVAARSLTVP
jgi:hypothetical protein